MELTTRDLWKSFVSLLLSRCAFAVFLGVATAEFSRSAPLQCPRAGSWASAIRAHLEETDFLKTSWHPLCFM